MVSSNMKKKLKSDSPSKLLLAEPHFSMMATDDFISESNTKAKSFTEKGMSKKSSRFNAFAAEINSDSQESDCYSVVKEMDGRHWLVSFNIKAEMVICQELLLEKDEILKRNPVVYIPLSELFQKMLKETKAPKGTWRNSFNHAKKQFEKKIEAGKLKSKNKPKNRGRKRENYFRVATLQAIKSHKPNELITDTVRRLYPRFEKQASSEANFVTYVLRLRRETLRAYASEKNSDFTLLDFAKTYLKQKPKPRKTYSKSTREK